MIQITRKSTTLIVMTAIFIVVSLPVTSAETFNGEERAGLEENAQSVSARNALDMVRVKLESAVNNYKQGSNLATQHDLEEAIDWLNKASQSSNAEKSREESRKLGEKIKAFKEKLNQSPAEHENSITRFWHQTVAIIEREIDQLTHSYAELLVSEQSLKYILDAKMHLFMASHDLFVSHSEADSVQELDKVIYYLDEAGRVSRPQIQKKIIDLSKEIFVLRKQIKRSRDAWMNNEVILSLEQAVVNLNNAKDRAPPQIKLRIDSLEAAIQTLRIEVETINIKNDYESAMARLMDIINELKMH